jgi:uncharacterized protein with FMN-binding domain
MTATAIWTRLGLGLASIALAAVLLLGFQQPDDGGSGVLTGDASSSSTNGQPATSGSGSGTSGSGSRTGSSGSGSSAVKVVDGTRLSTRYGPVQVELTVSGGKIVNITALALPTGGRSGRISSFAAPILASEALSAQSASIDLVSGATYTSSAYARSLQAALDQAGI